MRERRPLAASLGRQLALAVLWLLVPLPAAAQEEASWGVDVPWTVTGQGLYTRRLQSARPEATPAAAAFRAVAYPSLKLGDHWFGYAAIELQSTPYFYEQTYSNARELHAEVLQAFVGYSSSAPGRSVVVKAGRLLPAFGLFSQRYDDSRNALIDLPSSYGYYYKPVGLEGLTGLELEASLRRLDARLQITDHSPANATGVKAHDRYLQWNASAGYTIRQGLRLGVAGYRGPYMDRTSEWLSLGEPARDFPATAWGATLEWARGRWSTTAEWQHFAFPYPRFPTVAGHVGYAEAKVVLAPRWYAAVRAGAQRYNILAPSNTSCEMVVGFRPVRDHLLKLGYLRVTDAPSVVGVQYVTSLRSFARAFR
jgi:hypothetical protein